jgi:hypothetical protein
MVGARLEERNHLLFEHEVESFRLRVDGVLDELRGCRDVVWYAVVFFGVWTVAFV